MIKDTQFQQFLKSTSYIDPLLKLPDLFTALIYALTGNKTYSYALGHGVKTPQASIVNAYFRREGVKKLIESPFFDSFTETLISNFAKESPNIFGRVAGENKSASLAARKDIDNIESEGMSTADVKDILEGIIKTNYDNPELRMKAIEKYDKLFPLNRADTQISQIVILPPKNNTICPHCNRECLIHNDDGKDS